MIEREAAESRKQVLQQYATFVEENPDQKEDANAMLAQHERKMEANKRRMFEMFEKADVDKDGTLSWDEYR